MGLVDYSDSDISENEQQSIEIKNPIISKCSKKSFQKVVDITNPKKIRISLPQLSTTEEENPNEPPNKRIKLEIISRGFNSLLPAPKRAATTSNVVSVAGNASKKGLGSGVHLETGSTRGFSREINEETIFTSNRSKVGVHSTRDSNHEKLQNIKKDEKKINTLMFKPLSVSNKLPKKKNTSGSAPSTAISTLDSSINKLYSEKQSRILLFPLATDTEEQKLPSVNEDYQPILYDVSNTLNKVSDDKKIEVSFQENSAIPKSPPSSSLSSIADSLHLSDSERRQLFGRQKGNNKSAEVTNIINFNTDTEYLHNEEIRAAGEKVVNNPVRSIAPGKHSLKQLIHAAQSQKDALEESFAKGKSNRAEAGSRYGW